MEAVESSNRQRGFFSLLCGTINIKKNMPCISGDSVVENDDAVDETPAEPAQPPVIAYWKAEPNATDDPVVIPSPVLVSKRLAEEAVAKRRNVRFKGNDAIDGGGDDSAAECTSPTQAGAANQTSPTPDQNGTGKQSGKPRQKRMAPAPPAEPDAPAEPTAPPC